MFVLESSMADELLDLVNEKDEIIGEVWRNETKTNPKLLHREVAIIVYDDKNRILFQKRSRLKQTHPGVWSVTAAGHVGKGEDMLDTAHRELKEEVGFDTKLEFFDKVLAHLPNETHFTYQYTGKFPKDAKIVLDEREAEDTKFMSAEELTKFTEPIGPLSMEMTKKFWHNRGIS